MIELRLGLHVTDSRIDSQLNEIARNSSNCCMIIMLCLMLGSCSQDGYSVSSDGEGSGRVDNIEARARCSRLSECRDMTHYINSTRRERSRSLLMLQGSHWGVVYGRPSQVDLSGDHHPCAGPITRLESSCWLEEKKKSLVETAAQSIWILPTKLISQASTGKAYYSYSPNIVFRPSGDEPRRTSYQCRWWGNVQL
jgi:hypothetical protein